MVHSALSNNPFFYEGRKPLDKRKRVSDNVAKVATFDYIRGNFCRKLPQDFDSIVGDIPGLSKYKFPDPDPAKEVEILCDLLDHVREEDAVSLHYLNLGNEAMRKTIPQVEQPDWFCHGLPAIKDIYHTINNLAMDKHPGYPGIRLGETKGDVIEDHLDDLVTAVYIRMLCLMYVAEHCGTPEEFYEYYCADPCCVSIKDEPVKTEKLGRSINAQSVVTEVIEKLLYQNFVDAIKNMCYEKWSSIGVGFTSADCRLLHAACPLPSFFSDVPKFDSSVTKKENLMNTGNAIGSYGKLPDKIKILFYQLERTLLIKVFILNDGRVYVQIKAGYQCTGRFLTSIFNTMTRSRRSFSVSIYIGVQIIDSWPDSLSVLASYINSEITVEELSDKVGVDATCTCAGDDAREGDTPGRAETYEILGFPLRDAVVSDKLLFCSHEWPLGGVPLGERIYKSLYKMMSKKSVASDVGVSFLIQYSHHPEFPALFPIISKHRPEMNNYWNYLMTRIDYEVAKNGHSDLVSLQGLEYEKHKGFKKAIKKAVKKAAKSQLARTVKKDFKSIFNEKAQRIAGRVVRMGETAILGAGDYDMVGGGYSNVNTNSLIRSGRLDLTGGIPKFRKQGDGGFRVSECDYIGDVTGSIAFTLQSFLVNPANPKLFPWFSGLAPFFDKFKVHGLWVMFRPTGAEWNGINQALGYVAIAADYDVLDADYPTKIQLEQATGARSCKVSEHLIWGLESKNSMNPLEKYYINTTQTPDRFSHPAKIEIAVGGVSQPVNLGELWCIYDISLYEKQMVEATLNLGQMAGKVFIAAGAPISGPLGLVQPSSYPVPGLFSIDTPVGAGNTRFQILAPVAGMTFLITTYIPWTTAPTPTSPTVVGGAVIQPVVQNVGVYCTGQFFFVCTTSTPGPTTCYIDFASMFSGGTGPSVGDGWFRCVECPPLLAW